MGASQARGGAPERVSGTVVLRSAARDGSGKACRAEGIDEGDTCVTLSRPPVRLQRVCSQRIQALITLSVAHLM